jgi:hypothetical protein
MAKTMDFQIQGLRVQTWPRQWIFKSDENPQNAFPWKGSKASDPVL